MANFLFKNKMNRRLLTLTLLLSGLILTYFNIASAAPLADRLKGYILLQVQSHGEAWYVIPSESKRTYLANGETAYGIMSKLGLGIKNSDLQKIPVGIDSRIVDIDSDGDGLGDKLEEGLKTNPNNIDSDGDGYDDFDEVTHDYNPLGKEKNIYDQALINRLKGKILLQVEEKGQAWYINPVNGHRYYMKDGPSAYEIMRFLSLGITNDNLNQIAVSNFNIGTPTIPPIPPASVDSQAPTAPINLTAVATSTQIALIWVVSTDNVGVTQYQIERSTSANSGFTFIGSATNISYTNIGLTNNTTYYYRVRALDAAGNFSGYSNVSHATTAQIVVDAQAPTIPTSVTAVATSTQITIHWTASTDNVGVALYHIERSTSATSGFTVLTTVTGTTYINAGLSYNTRYYYRVRASDVAGNFSNYSGIVNAITSTQAPVNNTDTQVPTTPSNLTATATSTQINLSWTASTDNVGVSQYRIERSSSANPTFSQIATATTNSYIDVGLTPNITYSYKVLAVDGAGNTSSYSSIASTTLEDNYSIAYIAGEDYTLPASVTANNFSGYVCSNCTNSATTFIWTNWATIEPTNTNPRTYDWTYIDNQLAAAVANGKKVSLMLHSTVAGGIHDRSAVPDWVYEEFNLPPYDQLMNMGMTEQIHVIPSWRPEIRSRFEELIAALGARYKNNNTIESIYIGAISHSQGEELWISQPYLTTIERDWGLTPQVLQTWLESRMSAWLQAFPGEERKLVWVGSATGLNWNNRSDFELVAKNLIDYAASRNIGARAGRVEAYLDKIGDYLWSNYKDGNGYIYINESALRFDGRYWGDENEEYGPNFTYFGSDHSSPVRYRFAIMRALQARMRFLWTTTYTETINPSLSNYARLSFGKNVYDSPDAWAFLFQSPQSDGYPIKNFERWLIQRDMDGGITVPAQRVTRVFDAGGAYLAPSLWYDDTARRTDIASGNRYMFFGLDDRFTTSGTIQIKVEIVDDAQTNWHLDYYNSSGSMTSTRNIVNVHDNQKKTYTFTLHNPIFSNQFSGMDFRLVNEGAGDLIVSWVRLVRNLGQ